MLYKRLFLVEKISPLCPLKKKDEYSRNFETCKYVFWNLRFYLQYFLFLCVAIFLLFCPLKVKSF